MSDGRRRPGIGMPFRKSTASKRALGPTLRALLLLTGLLASAAIVVAYSIASRGLSAHAEPSVAERLIARTMRRWATPRAVRERANPVRVSETVLAGSLEHFADHCATCHANNGSGDTTIGRNLYPRVPDMRAERTQSLTDGELFAIIEHGIRLTGMPGWSDGTAEGERESWGLVHFVRRLPILTAEEIERMETLNPKTPAEFRVEEEARRFLEGGPTPSPSPSTAHGH